MIQVADNGLWKTFALDDNVTDDELGNLIGHDVYLIGIYGYGYMMENLYLRSVGAVIEDAERLHSGLICISVSNHAYVYMQSGKVAVWND